ncbi:hypothetical protein EVG20_g4336 [Dentipellis fragilis]|uniref:F-box domain-containing protein n=1 Tax=Dentipellis fragilis TaxID=205917 RepID=A0A4Y9YYB3_9AGAM|nr:hypothetical protein EVG20_g4336 [Dentipellis fragilis]
MESSLQNRKSLGIADGLLLGSLSSLPNELIILILTNLMGRDLLRCTQVCKSIHSIVNHAPELLYLVELWAEGFVDGPPSNISSHERMDLLVRRAAAWRSLSWKTRTTIVMPWAYTFRVANGIFLSRVQQQPDQLPAAGVPDHPLYQVSLATASSGFPQSGQDDFTSKYFVFDVPQDLLVLGFNPNGADANSRLRLQLRTLSSLGSSPHPAASQDMLPVSHDAYFDAFASHIQVAGPLLGIGVTRSSRFHTVLVWNWKTGAQLVDTDSVDRAPIDEFCFLTPHRMMLVSPTPSTLSLEIWSVDPDSFVVNDVRTLLRLALPDLGYRNFFNFCISHGPFHTDIPWDVPFAKRSGGRVYVISLRHKPPRPRSPRLLFVIRHDTIIAFLQRHIANDNAIAIPWEEWGPQNTRMFYRNRNIREHWNTMYNGWIYHERMLGCFMTSYDEDHIIDYEQILDFNVRPYMRQSSVAARVEGKGQLVTAPTTACVRVDDTGRTVTITTSLPFYSTPVDVPGTDQHIGFTLDEHHLLGVKALDFDPPSGLDIFSFE